MIDRAFELAWTHSQVVLRQINAPQLMPYCTAGWPARSFMPMLPFVQTPLSS